MADAPHRLVSAEKRPEDDVSLRPQRLADFAGQQAARRNLGPWDTEWSLAHWARVLRITTMAAAINAGFDENNDCQEFIQRVKNYLFYVASAA